MPIATSFIRHEYLAVGWHHFKFSVQPKSDDRLERWKWNVAIFGARSQPMAPARQKIAAVFLDQIGEFVGAPYGARRCVLNVNNS